MPFQCQWAKGSPCSNTKPSLPNSIIMCLTICNQQLSTNRTRYCPWWLGWRTNTGSGRWNIHWHPLASGNNFLFLKRILMAKSCSPFWCAGEKGQNKPLKTGSKQSYWCKTGISLKNSQTFLKWQCWLEMPKKRQKNKGHGISLTSKGYFLKHTIKVFQVDLTHICVWYKKWH